MIYFYLQNGDVLNWKPTEDNPNLPFGKSQALKIVSADLVGTWVGYTPNERGHLIGNELSRYISNVGKTYGWGCAHHFVREKQEIYCDPIQGYLDVEFYICINCEQVKDVYID
jgi:hypothetical protein